MSHQKQKSGGENHTFCENHHKSTNMVFVKNPEGNCGVHPKVTFL
jgi:hypothetical protein